MSMFGHKEAAIAGIGANGLRWKHKVRGSVASRAFAAAVDDLLTGRDDFSQQDAENAADEAQAACRTFANAVKRLADRHPELEMRMSESEALEYLREETIAADFMRNDPAEVAAEVREWFNEVYNWADYWRVCIM